MVKKIPFDVELWNSGKYDVVTGDGDTIKSLLIHPVECDYPIVVLTNNNEMENYTLEGKFIVNDDDDDINDLFLIPKKRKVWIGIEKETNDSVLGATNAYFTKEELMKSDYVKRCHIVEVELPE